jgi:hypothetical protein
MRWANRDLVTRIRDLRKLRRRYRRREGYAYNQDRKAAAWRRRRRSLLRWMLMVATVLVALVIMEASITK